MVRRKKGQAKMWRDRLGRHSRIGRVLGIAVGLCACSAAKADIIELRGGGELQGKVIDGSKKSETVQILLLKGKTPMTFQRKQIIKVIPKPSPLDEYLVKKQQVAATAESEFALGAWCDQHKLADLARVHYEAALGYDHSFAPAHKKLGHVQHGDQWLTPDEVRQVQGLVKYKGKWVTEEERAKREENAQVTAAQTTWVRRLKMLRQAILAGDELHRREAETELMHIEQPEAVLPLVKVLGQDESPMRQLLAHVLGGIPGKEASRALVNMILAEPEDDVRAAVMDRLKDREKPEVVPALVKALRAENVKVTNRSAWALGNLGAVTAVPQLVGALVTTEERMVMVPQDGGGGGGGGPGPVPGAPGALMAYNGSSAAYLTGPVVGPGVVAFGAVSVPLVGPNLYTGGNVLGINTSPNRGPAPRVLTYTYQNVEVLAALVKLTGQDFGYDGNAWRRWIKTSFNPNPVPERRVPQP
jgi:hypothetical protein